MSTMMDNVETTSQAALDTVTAGLSHARAAARRVVRSQPLWRNRAYLALWGAKIVSASGSQMTQVAFPLLVLALTHSAATAGVAGAIRMLPYLLFSLPAGALVDHWDRRRVMLICDTGRALALGSIPIAVLFGRLSVAQIFLVALIEGTLFVFFDLAELAALPSVVPPNQMAAATAQYLSLTEGVTTLLGPALGGALFAAGRSVPFLIDTISYVTSVITLRKIRLTAQPREGADVTGMSWNMLRGDIISGIAWLWRNPVLRTLTLYLGVNNALVAGEALLVIELANNYGAGTAEIGIALGIGGAGTVLGSLVAERVAARFAFNRLFIAVSWVVVPVWLLYAVVPAPLMLGVVMAMMGVLYTITNVSQFSYRMALIPDHLQGRVSSIIRLFVYGGMPIGLALTGTLIQRFGPTATVILLGIAMLLVIVITKVLPQLRTTSAPMAALENVGEAQDAVA